MSLTDLQIRKMKAPAKGQKTYFDDALKNFGVRVSQGGAKAFVVLLGPKRRRRTLGRYPELSLSDARLLAKQAQVEDALTQPSTLGPLPDISFDDAKVRFLADCDIRNKPGTVREYRRLLNRHFEFPRNLAELSRADIMKTLDKLQATPSEQQHAFVAIRTMMNWCRKRGMIETSPVPPLTFSAKTRSRILSDDELRAMWHRAAEFGYPYGRIIQILVLTGQRRGEIAGMRWNWIGEDTLTLPQGFAKNKREHVIPLGSMTLDILEQLPESGGLLFPARSREDRPFNGWSKSKRVFDKPIDVTDYTLHDLRRTFSSNMARLGVPIHVTERLLNHVSGTVSGVAAVYNRYSYMGEMREAIARHEEHIANLIRE